MVASRGLSSWEAAMWARADRAWVGDFGSGQALSDDQYRVIEPLIPPAKTRRAAADHRHAPPAGRPVLRRAHRLPVAAPAAPSIISSLAYGVRLLPGVPRGR